jgi:uncharacterized damage-inducible protein DinB
MITPQHLKNHYELNTGLIRRALDGLTQDDTLVQAPYSVNCINWTMGHILQGRESVLKLLGAPPQLAQEEVARYRRGSQPIGADVEAMPLERALIVLESGLAEIVQRLDTLSDADAARKIDLFGNGEPDSLLGWVFFFYFHDSYHTGELAVLRQLCGKPVKIV